MKMDKKECREFAGQGPALPPGHGLIGAKQIDYIVRTAIKIIDHHRTLVLYVYDRQQAAEGDLWPLWTMFQGRDDYITLARRPDGTTHWRTASFEKLGENYYFLDKCAFYSAKDQERLARFFHSDSPDFCPLVRAQAEILDRRRQKREWKRDQAIRTRMEVVPAMPRKLDAWAHRNIMPAYFVYDNAKGGRASGTCTSCGRESVLTGVKHNATGVCPHCGRTITMKPRGRIGRLQDRATFQVIQRTGPEELVIRIFKARIAYGGDSPGMQVRENARQFVRAGQDGTIQHEHYYFAQYSGRKWKQGDRPVFSSYSYNFEADTCGHVYCRGLSEALAGTPWQYCPIQEFYGHFREPMAMSPFLIAYLEHPRLEHLVKVGFFDLTSDLAYGRVRDGLLDEAQDRTHRLLGVAAEDVAFLRGLDVDAKALRMFRQYTGIKDRQRLFLWRREHGVERDVVQLLEHMTPHKLMRYLEQQYPALCMRTTQYGGRRYGDMQAVVSEYRDYLEMCVKLGYDMGNSFVLYPKDLQAAHDRVARRVKIKADIQMRQDFREAMKSISGHLDFEANGMKLLLPATPEELAAEGNALHHCVGGYADRVARKECIILFLRQCEELDKPFYTVEIRGRKIVQVRGMRNCDATPEVDAFMDRWEQRVLQRRDPEAA